MWHYLKFCLFHVFALLTIASILGGHVWIVYGYAFVLGFIILGDLLLGDDTSAPEYAHEQVLTWQLWLALPLTFALFVVSLWSISTIDAFYLGQTLTDWLGVDLLAAKASTTNSQHVLSIFFVGLMFSTLGTVTGHELVHRTQDKTSLLIGRWLLAFSFDSNFSIEHVYGHHRHLATPSDPASAPRGRNVYQHIWYSTVRGNISAWKLEAARLARRSAPIFSIQNVCLRGYAMSLALVLFAFAIAGIWGVLYFIACGLWAKAMLEIVNYMEHYGLVRLPNTPVQPRHSWNTNKKISSWSLFNLSRHSHHHAQGNLPFGQLKPMADSPSMPNGYLGTMCLTLIPPLWFKLMQPKLAEWDAHFASEDERALLANSAK